MIIMRVSNQKTTINNKVRAIEQIFVLDALRLGFKQICVKLEKISFPLFFLFADILRRV